MTDLQRFFDTTGIKKQWLARKLGVSNSTIGKISLGQGTPSPELAARIEALTGIDARILLGIPKPQNQNS